MRGERQQSRTNAGILPDDVTLPQPNHIVVADYGANWRHTKPSTLNDPIFLHWAGLFQSDPTYQLHLKGYSDCVGEEGANIRLRTERARQLGTALGTAVSSRIVSIGGAPLTDFLHGNTTAEDRARNRAVVILFSQQITLPVESVTGRTCPPRTATPAATLDDYVYLVGCAEHALPSYSPRQMLSMLRQLYYSPGSWSVCTGSTCAGWRDVIPCGLSIPDPQSALGANLFRSLRSSKVVGGVDMGHVFTGMEALACPRNEVELNIPGPNWIVHMPNDEFASWGGDLGSAAAQKYHEDIDRGTPQPWSNYFETSNTMASAEDLRGDIDSYVIAKGISGRSCTERPAATPLTLTSPISDVLADYYVNAPQSPTTGEPANRYACFVQAIGGRISGTTITNASDLVDAMTPRVFEFANMFFTLKYPRQSFSRATRGPLTSRSEAVSRLFVGWLQGKL